MRQGLFSLVAGKGKREARTVPRILLYESEARRIVKYAQSSPGLEIGGDLIGFYDPIGNPIVFVACGPGPKADRGVTHFQQDADFQAAVFTQLATKFRMFYIGDWHSHHGLRLSDPSGPDDAKLQDLANKNGWPQLYSLIVQTKSPGGRYGNSGHQDRISAEMPNRDTSWGPEEGFGIWWNAFHYVYLGGDDSRQRLRIDFQAGPNPYEATSEEIDSSIKGNYIRKNYEPRGLASVVLPPAEALSGTEVNSRGDEFLLNTYQRICSLLSGELQSATMELELDSDTPRLLVLDRGQMVTCTVVVGSRSGLGVRVEAPGRKEITLEVACKNRGLDSVEMRRIVDTIVDQFRAATERKSSLDGTV